ncbi:multicopper oxidase family protein [Carboxydothermus pertinax]|uniref:Copper oxidase n=1 Tax=Carboxydothermus pertinax TaxID=870242 RepID=A0A1L8CSC3_9THEO|nr:multicopper oxidase [Carboxydothermus pertinax]GAV21812.1 copper oxidase [Carboxydothermus pertinax]
MYLEKFVDPLPIPPVIKPQAKCKGIPFYKVTMKQFKQKLHRDLPPTTVWGYNGIYPGPTFEVQRNCPIFVKWENKLPFEHLLPVDRTVHGAELCQPSVRTVVHLHGGRVRPEDDGHPEAWFTQNFENVGTKFVHKIYYYPNCQRATTLWYHDHALGITRLNVYAGLAGFYLIRDEEEQKLKLPCGKYEIPLVIQDRSFYTNGELFYPTQPGHEPPPAPQPPPPVDPNLPNPSVVPEFFGNTILVNGKVWPYLEVEPRKYRFRILNGSNARFYRMRLSSDLSFVQIGTDGGFLEKPVTVSEITLAPGERADVIIDFSSHAGQNFILTNDAPTPFPDGGIPLTPDLMNVMQFRVKSSVSEPDKSQIPETLSCLERLNPNDDVMIRKMTLVESTDEFGRLKLLLNNMHWDELPITQTYNGTIEIWEMFNTTVDTHPIHLHLVQFQILNRAKFTGDPNSPDLEVGPPQPPDPNEMGWKDTVRANPGEVTRIIARFGPFTGIYPWHCHLLEHEDHEMMRLYEVLPNHNFNPCKPIPGECPDDSFTQCFNCNKTPPANCGKRLFLTYMLHFPQNK